MYASKVNDQRLTFAVSGKLWQRSLVMIDSQTESLWSHLLGQAMDGPLLGTHLETLPSIITDWKSWQRDHPDTSVLDMSKTVGNYSLEFYTEPSKWVIGMVEGGKARAWPMDQLLLTPVANDQLGGKAIVLVFSPKNMTTYVYDRELDGKTLTFAWRDNQLFDEQTDSRWDAATGVAKQGPMKGKSLKAMVGIISFKRPWSLFHPDSTFWRAK